RTAACCQLAPSPPLPSCLEPLFPQSDSRLGPYPRQRMSCPHQTKLPVRCLFPSMTEAILPYPDWRRWGGCPQSRSSHSRRPMAEGQPGPLVGGAFSLGQSAVTADIQGPPLGSVLCRCLP